MKTIPLTQGKVAIVDDEDYEQLSQNKWFAHRSKRKNHTVWRAVRSTWSKGRRGSVLMHREIMPGVEEIDHRDGDGLNNQKSNLRAANHSQNQVNQTKRRGVTSQFKGVYLARFRSGNTKWAAQITHNHKARGIGYFEAEEEAARAYDKEATRIFGDFARTNFPTRP